MTYIAEDVVRTVQDHDVRTSGATKWGVLGVRTPPLKRIYENI